ncbi:MAG TPA: phenylalanine--tRNA ligase subunit beta, partial [Coxiellaceae bacterium]|nr:phenylalanine--tRNA ligase subunit beta [Coxiellaceae bacterium]
MKLSEQWLREWVNPPISTKVLGEQLTMAGLEVDSIIPAAPAFNNVIVGFIKEAVQHPDADRLRVCKVDVGQAEPLQIVCGAANARAGIKVAVAMVDAVLPGDFKINRSKIRGVESCGMLCSSKELGLTEEAEGIMELLPDAPLGTNIRDYLKLDDQVIEVELTPNRGDCLSVQGVARELAAVNQLGIIKTDYKEQAAAIKDNLHVDVLNSTACPRYLGRVIRGINTDALTPLWMQERLRRSGIRNIHPVVDIMNYVMLELGQPLHAFDLNKLKGTIQVRLAALGEKISLLDGQEIKLNTSTLVIADEQGPQAIAGIMGGLDSAVTQQTHDLFLESAFFTPASIGVEARQYGLQTDASYRFERGVDPELPRLAMNRACELLQQIVGGQLGPITEVVAQEQISALAQINLNLADVKRLLGLELKESEITRILTSLGIQILTQEQGVWQVQAPSFRFDLRIAADIIEEIARLVGYDQIPVQSENYSAHIVAESGRELNLSTLTKTLVSRAYQEVISYSFIDPEWQQLFNPEQTPIRLANPLTQDMSVMRTSLWPGLVKIAHYNLARQASRVRIFEKGLCFSEGEQRLKIGALITGNLYAEQWGTAARPVDFFDLKADLEALLALSKQANPVKWLPAQHPALHPGQSAQLELAGHVLGYAGALHPRLVQALDLKHAPFLFELDFELCKKIAPSHYQAISKFPAVRRD